MKWNIGWGTISKCNMNCEFCYSKTHRQKTADLGYADWVQFIDENHAYIRSINYGTGENTLSNDWFLLVSYIRDHYPAIRQAVTTNGYLSVAVSDQNNMRSFIKAIDEVDVSLDFADSARHNTSRGQPSAYRWAIDTLKLCMREKKQTTIVFLGSQITTSHENIDGLFSIAKKYNAILRMNMYRPTDGINEYSQPFIISRSCLVDVLTYINEKYHILTVGDAYFSPVLTGEARPDPSGDVSIRILSDGSITPSTYLIGGNYKVANIKQKKVLQQLESEGTLKKIIREILPPECKGCAYEKSCQGGVFDRRYLWHGTLDKKDPYCSHLYTEKIPPAIIVKNTGFSSVHDGYLPTMFFKP